MSAKDDYINAERKELEKTITLIEELAGKDNLSGFEVIALGKLLQDIYMSIERILRFQLEKQGIKTDKSSSWHKDLLIKASSESLVSKEQYDFFGELLLFRHLQIHGYGQNLDEVRLRQLAEPVGDICRDFLSRIQ
ncbi:MAG: hypothetical protein JXD22_09865 [Sedimentisphaerales bacterium]|nr:hypothetical protein [Sedimentisphaerales bacterium]